jgi:hypothetical protein
MTCELIEDEHGWWWLQYETPIQRRKHCYLMDATDEIDAQFEAMQEGFNDFRVCRLHKPVTTVTIPKSPFP